MKDSGIHRIEKKKPDNYREKSGQFVTAYAGGLLAWKKGIRAERLACLLLMMKGFRIIECRWKTRAGEVDVIAKKRDLVLIVEVKARKTLNEAMEAITCQSEKRIEAAADLWLSKRPDFNRLSIRFDLIAILPWRWPVHVESFFNGRK